MKKIPFRIRYFLSHLLVSLMIASLSVFLIFYIWYPNPLQKALGVGDLVVMMLAIDVILGPLLTLVLAKEGKKGLKTDLIVIGIVQLSALFYGLYSVDKGRPVALAFDINRFEVVAKHQVKTQEHKKLIKQYADTQTTSIPTIAIRPAKDDAEYAKRMENELEHNILAISDPTLYQSIEQNIDVIKQTMRPIANLAKLNGQEATQPILERYPTADGFLPLAGSAQTVTMLIDSKNKKVLAVVELRPW